MGRYIDDILQPGEKVLYSTNAHWIFYLPAIAETTTATSWPASTSRLTWRATFRMRSILATDVPPNFITRRPMATSAFPEGLRYESRAETEARGPKGAYT